ncbi:MAG: fused MFS/spermidine synthase [Anaerolineae bacterium]|nr:fused MFS/spermidine synthase [Anaerolineae bacterium]
MATEMCASRLLSMHFGTSSPVWASVIGLILLYLTVGYFIGGRWADRSPQAGTLYRIVAWAGFLTGLVPFVAQPVLALVPRGFLTFNIAMLVGTFATVLILFSVPVTLLGCVSPFIIRLAIDDVKDAGSISGRAYAVSTAGSFIGTFLPDLLLAPTIGTRNTFVLISLFLVVIAFIGLLRSSSRTVLTYIWMPVIVILLAVFLRGQPVKAAENAIYETESSYNYIQIIERGDCRYLLLNEGQGTHSIYCKNSIKTPGPWDYFLIAPYFNPPPFTPDRVRSVALIGLAGGTISKQYTEVYGAIPIDGVEIDPKIVEAGRDYLAMNEPNLNVIVSDGRYFLANSSSKYTVIGIDAFRLPYIPPHLTTVEFFQHVRDHLTPDGVVVINAGRTPTDYRVVAAIKATLLQIFPTVHVIEVPDSFNAIIVATVQESKTGNLLANLPGLEANEFLYSQTLQAAANLRAIRASDLVFTDDHAGIELLTNLLVLNFALKGE